MSLGETAYLGLVLTGFTLFAVILFWLSIDELRRARRLAADPVYRIPPSGSATAHA